MKKREIVTDIDNQAGKKLRLRKPTANWATEAIIENGFPFLALPEKAHKDDLLNACIKALTLAGSDSEEDSRACVEKNENEWRSQETEEEIRQALVIGKKMIQVASGLDIPNPQDFSEEVKRLYNLIPYNLTWDKRATLLNPHFAGAWNPITNRCVWIESHAKGLKLAIVYYLANSLRDGNGLYYFSACPRCQKVFEKNRGDQEYCSVACQTATTQKRYDRKKKKILGY